MTVDKDNCSTTEITAAVTAAEGYTSNEDSLSHTADDEESHTAGDNVSHITGNDVDEEFKAWENDDQNFDKDEEQSIKSSPPNTNS